MNLSVISQQGVEVGREQIALSDDLYEAGRKLGCGCHEAIQVFPPFGNSVNCRVAGTQFLRDSSVLPCANRQRQEFRQLDSEGLEETHLDSTLSAIPLKDGEYVYHYGEDGASDKAGSSASAKVWRQYPSPFEVAPQQDGFVDVKATYSFEGNLPELSSFGLDDEAAKSGL